MKRAIFMAMFASSLMLGPVRTYAFPNSPCAPKPAAATANSFSGVQLLLLLQSLLAPIG